MPALAMIEARSLQRPPAIVVIGGLLSSTFLTLVLLPVLYEWVEQKSKASNEESGTPTEPNDPSPKPNSETK